MSCIEAQRTLDPVLRGNHLQTFAEVMCSETKDGEELGFAFCHANACPDCQKHFGISLERFAECASRENRCGF